MQVTIASFFLGVCVSDPCRSRFSDGSLVQGREPNLSSKALYILLVFIIELIGHGSFSQGGSEPTVTVFVDRPNARTTR